ncbi:MAG: PKD domain-containing protein [Saprospiraceae bacterium]|nr:PKD domain-containing protein [Saprospiraceae bacterium]
MRRLIYILAIIHFGVPFGWAQPVADFSASNREGCGSLEVIFNNQSTGTDANTKYLWDLSGVSSDRPNPGRIFETPGKYNICLTATNANGSSNRVCKTEFIVVYALPRVDFTLDRTKGCAPLDINFTNLSKADNPIKELTWDVGGSANVVTTSSLDSTINSEYSLRGKYSVSLTVIDDKNCSNTFLKGSN